MVWAQLCVNKPHLAYLILGGFTSLFMLCSLFVKEKLYIGEATVATLCGVIFGPHAANLFNPLSWGNVDQITLECSRVVLVVQCFAVGVELPKAYMERHWRSVVFLLVPVMTFGWLVTSLFIWWLIEPLSWLESLMCAACVTATDPVLASSVVGKGKFAKRVPKHLRDVLSAESGCNDGMAFPFIYLSFYLIHYKLDAAHVTYHWFCNVVLYECIFGAFYGVCIGYFGRHAIKWADRRGLIDRESFLVFYFTLALFAAGTGATLGTDDLLVGFAAGVGFSNDGWFTQKTEESHVSNVIDLLLNLAYFVFLGSIIPWGQYNNPEIGLTPWRLSVIALLVVFFRRIPIMMLLKPVIPDIKTWREALFAGHFGPIGVGAIFAAILARAELETGTTVPLAKPNPDPLSENYAVIQVIWPLTTFLVITSILVHGSSIAVFTLGKRINTLTLTMSYTQANEDGPSWMNRLPRIATSTSKASMSKSKEDFSSESSSAEKLPEFPPGTLPPIGMPGNFLRRQKEEETPLGGRPRPTSRRKSRWDSGMGPGGPIEKSAITPQRTPDPRTPASSPSDTLDEKDGISPGALLDEEPPDQLEMEEKADREKEKEGRHNGKHIEEPELEAFEEGNDLIVEDEEGNIVSVDNIKGETQDQIRQHIIDGENKLRKDSSGEYARGKYHPHERNEGEEWEKAVGEGFGHPTQGIMKKLNVWNAWAKKKDKSDAGPSEPKQKPPEHKRGAAHAYQFGNTIIVEDEDGEVLKKYDIPHNQRRHGRGGVQDGIGGVTDPREALKRMGSKFGYGAKNKPGGEPQAVVSAEGTEPPEGSKSRKKSVVKDSGDDDEGVRFTTGPGGRRMSKADLIQHIAQLDPKSRVEAIQGSNMPEPVKEEVREQIGTHGRGRRPSQSRPEIPPSKSTRGTAESISPRAPEPRLDEEPKPTSSLEAPEKDEDDHSSIGEDLHQVRSIPTHSVTASVSRYSAGRGETAAARRRRLALPRRDSDDDGTPRVPPHSAGDRSARPTTSEGGETAAERRRRLAALGEGGGAGADSDSEDDGRERRPVKGHEPVAEPGQEEEAKKRVPTGIRFADSPAVSQGRVQWGEGVTKKTGSWPRT